MPSAFPLTCLVHAFFLLRVLQSYGPVLVTGGGDSAVIVWEVSSHAADGCSAMCIDQLAVSRTWLFGPFFLIGDWSTVEFPSLCPRWPQKATRTVSISLRSNISSVCQYVVSGRSSFSLFAPPPKTNYFAGAVSSHLGFPGYPSFGPPSSQPRMDVRRSRLCCTRSTCFLQASTRPPVPGEHLTISNTSHAWYSSHPPCSSAGCNLLLLRIFRAVGL